MSIEEVRRQSDSQLPYPERSPPIGAITTSHATVLMHRFYKFCYPLRNDSAFDCNEYWSLREIGSNFLDDEGHAPVVPWTQIRGRLRKFCEEHEHHTPDCSKSGTDKSDSDACSLGYRVPSRALPRAKLP